jgi:hypothetical protein
MRASSITSNRQTDKQFLSTLLEVPMAAELKRSNETPTAAEPRKSRFELTNDLIKAGAWPLFALIVLIVFLGPFRAAANLLPDIVGRATSIKLGDVAIEIERKIPPPSEEVRPVLAAMTADDINKLLETPVYRIWTPEEKDLGRSAYARTIELGIFGELSDKELQSRTDFPFKPAYGVTVTPLGEKTRQYLSVIIDQFTQELVRHEQPQTP